ncbi:hypothetical protein NPIL_456071, partial [Nephila pilipes]
GKAWEWVNGYSIDPGMYLPGIRFQLSVGPASDYCRGKRGDLINFSQQVLPPNSRVCTGRIRLLIDDGK